jgi:hypothetical protein
LFALGLLKPGMRLSIKGHPGSEAMVVDGHMVEFRGERLSYNALGLSRHRMGVNTALHTSAPRGRKAVGGASSGGCSRWGRLVLRPLSPAAVLTAVPRSLARAWSGCIPHLLNGLNVHAGLLTYAVVGRALGIDVLSPRWRSSPDSGLHLGTNTLR